MEEYTIRKRDTGKYNTGIFTENVLNKAFSFLRETYMVYYEDDKGV